MASENSIYTKFRRFCTQLKLDDRQIDELFEKVRQKRIKCAWCGKTSPKNGEEWKFPGGKIDIVFGYGSKRDMEKIDAYICDDCYGKKFLTKSERNEKSVRQLLSEELAKCSSQEEKELAKKRVFTKIGKKLCKDRKRYNLRGWEL